MTLERRRCERGVDILEEEGDLGGELGEYLRTPRLGRSLLVEAPLRLREHELPQRGERTRREVGARAALPSGCGDEGLEGLEDARRVLIPLARHAQTLHRLAILDERAVGECGGQIEERRRALEGERGLALLAEGLEGVFPHVVDV